MQASGDRSQPAFSEACERNKGFILEVLRRAFADVRAVLEVGSGTGQHVVHFAQALGEAVWQPADQAEYLPALTARLQLEAPANVLPAVELDVRSTVWPVASVDGVFSANTLHYMGTDCVAAFFQGVGQVLAPGGTLAVYGPFRYGGEYTSASNARFDHWLNQSDSARGIRDFEWVNELAAAEQLKLSEDVPMPANNQLLIWRKQTSP